MSDDLWKQGLPNTNYTTQNASINILTLYLAILTLEPLLFIPHFPLGLLLLLHPFWHRDNELSICSQLRTFMRQLDPSRTSLMRELCWDLPYFSRRVTWSQSSTSLLMTQRFIRRGYTLSSSSDWIRPDDYYREMLPSFKQVRLKCMALVILTRYSLFASLSMDTCLSSGPSWDSVVWCS